MTLLTEKGTFVKETSNVDGTDQTINLSNSSLTPKALWLWTTGGTANGTYHEGYQIAYGFSDGTNDACIWNVCEDNSGTSDNGGMIRNDAVISIGILSGTIPTESARADVLSFNAGNFVLNWAVSDATASIIHYMVIGGTDITNVKVTSHTVPSAAGTGNEAYAGVGFAGDFINIITGRAGTTVNTANGNIIVGIGAATSSSARWAFGGYSNDADGVSSTFTFKETTDFQFSYTTGNSPGLELMGDFVSFDSDGFTINYSTENIASTAPFASLVIKGGLWNVGTGQAPAATGQQTINTTSGRDPEAVMFFTWGTTTNTGSETENRLSIGGADNSLNEGCISAHDTDATTNMINTSISLNTKLIRRHTANATAGSSTTQAEADIVDMDNDGNFIIDWTTTLNSMDYVWFAISKAIAGTNFERSPSADSVTVSDVSTTRILSAARVPASESVTVTAGTATRMLSATRIPSSDSITIAEASLSRSKTWPRVPTAEDVTVSDVSTTRILSALRIPSTESSTTSEGLTRMLQLFRTPTPETVITSESLSGGKLLERTVSADSITVADSSLTRLLLASRQPSTDDITTGENLTRILSAIRSPTLDSITAVDSSTTQSLTRIRVPNTEDVIVTDVSLQRLLSATRVPSTEVTSVSDASLVRVLSALRIPTTEIVDIAEDIDSLHTTAGQFNRAPNAETVDISENLFRSLQLFRTLSSDSVTINENVSGGKLLERVVAADTVNIVEASLTRILSLSRSPTDETSNVVEASLTRLLQAFRTVTPENVTVNELQSLISHSRSLQDTIAVTEPLLERIVTSIRELGPEFVDVAEQVFFQTWHRFVFDSVIVAEQLFSERQSLSGSVTYATPAEVRPLLGNLGSQRTDAQIQLAIDSAYDEINRKTGRQPPDDWKDTENDFGIVKKICRFKAALEMAVGIKDFEDREWMQKEIEEMFKIIEEGEGEAGTTSTDIVGSSTDETYALNESGIIWSTRYKNLRKNPTAGSENSTTINPDT